MTSAILVQAVWDDEAGVWVATSDDVPGLVAEHRDFIELQKLINELIPVLLVENNLIPAKRSGELQIPVQIAAQALAWSKTVIAS